MEQYVLVFEVKAIDYNDAYNSVVRDILGSPKITITFEHTITINTKPTKDLINKIIEGALLVNNKELEII